MGPFLALEQGDVAGEHVLVVLVAGQGVAVLVDHADGADRVEVVDVDVADRARQRRDAGLAVLAGREGRASWVVRGIS